MIALGLVFWLKSKSITVCIFDFQMQIILEDFKAYDDFKNKQKRARTDVFFICKSIYILKVYLIEYINIEIKHKFLKKFPSNKINVTKCILFNAFCVLLRALLFFTSFNFNSWFLHELKYKVRLLKVYAGVGFSIFDSVSLIFEFTLSFNKKHGLFDFKTPNSIQN